MKLRNKLIWITGASGGLGKAMAVEMAREKSALILSARNKEALLETSRLCLEAGAVKTEVIPVDMAESRQIEQAVKQVLSDIGCPDILINNAGISQRSLVKETDMSVYRRIFEIDFFGAIYLNKLLLAPMLEKEQSQVVVTSSLVGKFSTPFRSGYAAAKHALHGFYEALRTEHYRDGLVVTMLCPGFIRTDVSKNALTGSGDKLGKMDDAQSSGMDPETFAKKAVKAIKASRSEVVIGGKERFGVLFNRLFPALFKRLMRQAKVR